MGRADDHVRRLRVRGEDLGQGIDHQLVALARREQAEAQDHVATLDRERGLDRLGGKDRQVGDAVGQDRDLIRVDAIVVREQGRRGARHHDRGVRRLDDLDHDLALPCRRVVRERVQRHG